MDLEEDTLRGVHVHRSHESRLVLRNGEEEEEEERANRTGRRRSREVDSPVGR